MEVLSQMVIEGQQRIAELQEFIHEKQDQVALLRQCLVEMTEHEDEQNEPNSQAEETQRLTQQLLHSEQCIETLVEQLRTAQSVSSTHEQQLKNLIVAKEEEIATVRQSCIAVVDEMDAKLQESEEANQKEKSALVQQIHEHKAEWGDMLDQLTNAVECVSATQATLTRVEDVVKLKDKKIKQAAEQQKAIHNQLGLREQQYNEMSELITKLQSDLQARQAELNTEKVANEALKHEMDKKVASLQLLKVKRQELLDRQFQHLMRLSPKTVGEQTSPQDPSSPTSGSPRARLGEPVPVDVCLQKLADTLLLSPIPLAAGRGRGSGMQ
eukprot:TRINITY_DN66224_c1_g1_i1.p1 TRINITY_DN66224_c1_g1~~TRINITY_DN66224_c1_g1_i1.p1  ORF type:complete len:343 (-),score=57.30 TRINITY_DN66224_c1_g1_i1:69-1046(-)